MTDTPNRPPLWRKMQEAGDEAASAAVLNFDGFAIAAELRVVRDWLVPEEPEPLGPAGKAHMELRALLTAEADRAERGDG